MTPTTTLGAGAGNAKGEAGQEDEESGSSRVVVDVLEKWAHRAAEFQSLLTRKQARLLSVRGVLMAITFAMASFETNNRCVPLVARLPFRGCRVPPCPVPLRLSCPPHTLSPPPPSPAR